MSQPPPNPKPRRLTPCHRHPNLPTTTGLCAPCLHERLSLLTPSTSASTASSSTSTTAAELRRCKTFSAKNCDVILGVEPRRRSCDVRGRYSLSSLFNLDDNDGENDGVLVQSKNLGFLSRTSGPYPCPWPYPVLEEEEIVEVESEDRVRVSNFGNVVDDDEFELEENSKTMKEFIDLEFEASNNCKSSKSYNRKEFKEIAGSFWIAASVFSKKFRKWGKKQQRSGNEGNVGGCHGGGGVGLGEMKLENLRGRRLRDTQSEVGEYGFGRRSCDVDPRGSIDLGRASIDCGGLGRRSCDMDTRGSIDLGRRSCDIDARGSIGLERKLCDVDTRGSIDLGRRLCDSDTRDLIYLERKLCDIDTRGSIDLERKLCVADTRGSIDLGRKSCDMDTRGLSDLGRRSCDTDPRFSIDLARASVDCGRISVDDVGRNEFDAPRASWDGYLIGGRQALPRGNVNVPMVSVIENAMATVYGFDNRVLSEGKVKVDNVSAREKWRNGFDGCSSVKRDMGVIADGEGKGLSNASVSPSAVGIFNGTKLLITEKELNEWRLNSNSLRDDNSSESFETASKDLASVSSSSNGKSFKKCRQWSKLWSIWGLLNRKKGDKEGERENLESPDAECVDHSARKLTRNHSSSSSRSSSMVVGSTSGMTGRDESKTIVRSRQEAVVLHRNRSARYSPNQLDNGLLRFYLTPLRSRRRNRPGKSRLKNSKSLARSVFRL